MENREVYYKITTKKMITLLFGLCWVVYFSTYLGRLNYSACLTEMIQAEGFSKESVGLIGTSFFFAYGIGQFISGFLGDKLSPKWLVFTGLTLSSIANLVMSLLHTPAFMAGVWCINGLAQALIWSPMIRLLFDYLKTEQRMKSCVYLNSTVPIGTMVAYGMTAGVIFLANWRVVFILASGLLFAIAFVWLIGMGKVERYAKTYGEVEEKVEVKKENGEVPSQMQWKTMMLESGCLFLLFALIVQGALKDGVTTWIPTYISETYALSSVLSIISTMVIPLSNLMGVYLASAFNDKFFKDEIKTSGAFYAICACSLLVLRIFSGKSMIISLLMLAISTTTMMAVNTMLIAVLPSYFGKVGRASSVSGILNSSVYVGGALSTYGIGALSSAWGWNNTIMYWVVSAVLAGIVCFSVWKKWKRYKNKYLA